MRKLTKYINIVMLGIFILSLSLCSKENNNLAQAKKHLKQKEYEEAIAFYEEAIKNNSNVKNEEEKEITETLYQLGNKHYQQKNYHKTIITLQKLIKLYPNTPYKKKATNTIKLAYQKNIQTLFDKKKLNECLKQIKEYNKLYSLTENIQEIETKVHYNIALNHYNKQEYFLANTFISKIRASSKPLASQTIELKEKILFQDGKKQFLIKAYKNARKIFKELLISFPESKYRVQTEKYIKEIETIRKTNHKDKNNNAKIKTNSNIEKLEEKGYEENNPYNKNDILKLIEYFREEKEKNEENLKQNIFPLFKDRYIKLEPAIIRKYSKNDKTGILEPKTRSKLDGILNWETDNEISNYKYILHLKAIPQLLVLIKKEDFLKLNFKKPIKPIELGASILKSKIENKKIKVFIKTLNIKQK